MEGKRNHQQQYDFSLKTIRIVCCLAIVMAVIVAIFFAINQHYELGLPVATDVLGQYGDFCGGVFSSIIGFFSIVLLYKTLKSQNETLEKQKKEIDFNNVTDAMQQTHSRYLHLMEIYEDVVKSLNIKEEGKNYKGKKAIEYLITSHFDEVSSSAKTSERIKSGKIIFMRIYSSEPSFFPVYFRIIYRIMNTLDMESEMAMDSPNETGRNRIRENAIGLIKMFRAQLTSYELVLLKYNSMLPQGRNSAYYIDKYNLLKHLLPLDLFEFRYYVEKLGEEKDETNILLLELKYAIADVLNKKEKIASISSIQTESHINVTQKDGKLNIIVSHKNRVRNMIDDRFDGLLGLENNCKKDLLKLVASETLAYSQHSKLNKYNDLNFDIEDNGKEKLEIVVSSRKGNVLRANLKSITKSQWENI